MQANCSGCGKPIADAEIFYSPEGAPLCTTCNTVTDIRATEARASAQIANSAYSALALAVLSFVFNPFFMVTIASFASGSYAIRSIKLDPKSASSGLLACAWIGVGISILRVSAIFWLPFLIATSR
jgi:hypothetical protein